MYLESSMLENKLCDLFAPMDGSPIPQKDHRTAKLLEQLFEESPHIQASEVMLAKLDVEGQSLSLRGERQSTDRGDSVLLVHIVEKRRPASGSPGTGDRGNKQKAGFIQEKQVGPTSFGVFLYEANGSASNE